MKRFRDPRTGPFEAVLRRGSADEIDTLLRDRHEYWSALVYEQEQESSSEPEKEKKKQKEKNAKYTLPFLIVGSLYLVWLFFNLFMSLGPIALLYAGAVLLFFLLALGTFKMYGISAEQELKMSSLIPEVHDAKSRYRKMMQGGCLQCGYELTGCRDAMPVVPEGSLGPRRCPECAAYWPLVPEPTPEEMHKWHRSWFRR